MSHLHPSSAIFFVTCTLNQSANKQAYLADPAFARILMTRIDQYNGKLYDLIAYTISSNQFHMLIDTSIQQNQLFDVEREKKKIVDLQKIISKIKQGSERYINQVRNSVGEEVWATDHSITPIRDEKLFNDKITYIKENPVKALLVESYENHPFTYIK